MCSGSEEGSYLRLIDSLYHSTIGLRVNRGISKLLLELLAALVVPSEPVQLLFRNTYLTEMWSGSEEGSYLRLIDFCITQL